VGLPGAGKSAVGALVARALGWRFVDLDVEIERLAGRSVAAIFAEEGEARFRVLERDATIPLRGAPASVVAPGGGWAAFPETVALLRPPARMTYLRVSPGEAASRLGRDAQSRPLLRDNPVVALERLLAARETAYAAADCAIDTEVLSLQQVAASIVARIGAIV
jgi:shikimate kinase